MRKNASPLVALRAPGGAILALVILFGAVIRLASLDSLPAGLHGDEVSIGYTAYSLLKTGRDQNGIFLPLAVDQFGDFRPAGYHYLTVPFVYALGLTETAVRLPSALFGILAIPLLYLFILELWGRKNIALVSAFFLSVSPWHVNISRATSEGVVSACFILLGSVFYLRWTKKHSARHLLLSLMGFFTAMFFYHTARIFVLCIVPVFSVLGHTRPASKPRRQMLFSVLHYGTLVLATVFFLVAGRGTERTFTVSIANIPGGHETIIQQIAEDGHQNQIITRFFHNKVVYYGRAFLSSFFTHAWGEFLFVNTGKPVRYRIPWTGNMFLSDLPFLMFGFSVLLVSGIKKNSSRLILPAWLVFAVIPAALTWEDVPNVQRSSLMIYALLPITALGVFDFFASVSGKTRFASAALFGFLFFHGSASFLHNYFHHARIDEPWHRSAASKELAPLIREIAQTHKILMTTQGNNNFIHYLFYNAIDPRRFHGEGSPREHEGLLFDNIQFTGNRCPIEGDPESVTYVKPEFIYVNNFNCSLPKNTEVLHEIRNPDNSGAYAIVRILPVGQNGQAAPF